MWKRKHFRAAEHLRCFTCSARPRKQLDTWMGTHGFSFSLSTTPEHSACGKKYLHTHPLFKYTRKKALTHTQSLFWVGGEKRENDNKRGTTSFSATFCCVEQCPHIYPTYTRRFRHFYFPFVMFYCADGTCKIIEYLEVCLTTQWILSLQQLVHS